MTGKVIQIVTLNGVLFGLGCCGTLQRFVFETGEFERVNAGDQAPAWPDTRAESAQVETLARVRESPSHPWQPYLSNYADGVDGHYAILRFNPEITGIEVWNLRSHEWASSSDDVLTLDQAHRLLQHMRPVRLERSADDGVDWSKVHELAGEIEREVAADDHDQADPGTTTRRRRGR